MEDYRSTLLHSFLHWEAKGASRIFLTQPYVTEEGTRVVDYTWAEIGQQTRRVAAYLQSFGFPPGSSIAILGKNSAHWIAADLAIWMAGCVSVPLYPTLNAATAAYVLHHAEVKLMILGKLDGKTDSWEQVRQAIPADLPLIGLPMSPRTDIPQWAAIVKSTDRLQSVHSPKRDELATIVYTSGSTGTPKGVMHSFGSMTRAAATLGPLFDISEHERMLSYLPLAHVAERAAIESMALYYGFRVYFAGDLSTFQADLTRARPTIFLSVPRLWTKFYLAIQEKLPPRLQKVLFSIPGISSVVKRKFLQKLGLDKTRIAATGAAPIPVHIVDWYRQLGLNLLEVYGMSEDFGVSHVSRSGATRLGYVGTPAPGVLRRIAEDGEILIHSPGRMLGYHKQPELTAQSFTADGYFRTGDQGEVDDQGRLRLTGRIKELFKTGKGKWVAPSPIEQKIAIHPKVDAVCVTGPGQPQPFAVLTLIPEVRREAAGDSQEDKILFLELSELLRSINAGLEAHERLQFLVVVNDQWSTDNGLLTPTLKIKRASIEQKYLPNAERWFEARQQIIWE